MAKKKGSPIPKRMSCPFFVEKNLPENVFCEGKIATFRARKNVKNVKKSVTT
jgi:hypothetical protein